MMIDDYLAQHDVAARYQVDVRAPIEQVYHAVRNMDLSRSSVVRLLFRLRELPALFKPRHSQPGLGLTLDDLTRSGFIPLGETPPHEILLGVVGRFWTSSGCIQRLDADGFRAFDQRGFAKAVWNFSLSEREASLTSLSTETRVYCLDDESRRRFRLYWALIGPFSGLIRKEALRAVRRQAEAAWQSLPKSRTTPDTS
jgi:hypothetical protein